jgi:hypothetical protein
METMIFATRSDLIPGIQWVESRTELHYVRAGLYSKDEINELNVFDSLRNVEEIGYNTTGQYITGTQFLVVERKHRIRTETIKQRKGGYLFDVGPSKNPHSIIFQPNGIYQDSYLIRGNIGTVSESKESIELYGVFSKGIVKGFTRVKGWYVGPEALKLMASGVRLITMHVEESLVYDVKI